MPPKGTGPKRNTIEWRQFTIVRENTNPNQPKVKCVREDCGREFSGGSARLIEHICGFGGNIRACPNPDTVCDGCGKQTCTETTLQSMLRRCAAHNETESPLAYGALRLPLHTQEVKALLLRQRAEKLKDKAAADKKRRLNEATAFATAANKAAAAGKQPGIKDSFGGQCKADVRAPAAIDNCSWQIKALHAPWSLATRHSAPVATGIVLPWSHYFWALLCRTAG